MTGVLLMGLVALVIVRGIMMHTDVYAAFQTGASRGMRAGASLLPALCAMLLMLRLLTSSGLTELLARLLAPLTELAGIPSAVTPLILLRPLTGSGSMAALQEIFRTCGVDSRAGMIASALMGSSETIVYTMTVYAGAAGVRRLPGVMAASLAGYAAGVIVCVLLTG